MSRTSGVVKWFNVRRGFGYITRNDTQEDIFVHYTGISKPNRRKLSPSLSDGEPVEFVVFVGHNGLVAGEVTGPNGKSVKGSPYTAFKEDFFLTLNCYKRNRHST